MKKNTLLLIFLALAMACSKKEMDVEYISHLQGKQLNETNGSIPNPNPNPNPNPSPSPSPNPNPNPSPSPNPNPNTCSGVASANNFLENWDDDTFHGKTTSNGGGVYYISSCYTRESLSSSDRTTSFKRTHNGSYNAVSGSMVIKHTSKNNEWIYRAFQFEAGEYEITAKVAKEAKEPSSALPSFQIAYGNADNYSNMQSGIIVSATPITGYISHSASERGYQTIVGRKTFSSAGTYYIGFNINSLGTYHNVFLDDITIKKVSGGNNNGGNNNGGGATTNSELGVDPNGFYPDRDFKVDFKVTNYNASAKTVEGTMYLEYMWLVPIDSANYKFTGTFDGTTMNITATKLNENLLRGYVTFCNTLKFNLLYNSANKNLIGNLTEVDCTSNKLKSGLKLVVSNISF